MSAASKSILVEPSARRLSASLRDVGYDFVTAMADVIDNSISAQATEIEVNLEFEGAKTKVFVCDNGRGMTSKELNEAFRFGSRRSYEANDLGKFGLGLKTASLSQCRRLVVATKRHPNATKINARCLDLDWIEANDRWEVQAVQRSALPQRALDWLESRAGTVVIWDQLDRVLSYADPDGRWAQKRIHQLGVDAADYLKMVFHRFLESDADLKGSSLSKMSVNGEILLPWDPFARDEKETQTGGQHLPSCDVSLTHGDTSGRVVFTPYVLPSRALFSTVEKYEQLSGPLKWNRQQGLYVYRANRLIQYGGWAGIRTSDEHTKLARASIDFGPELDDLFQVNVAKMRVVLPEELKESLNRPISQLCTLANRSYRETADAVNGTRPVANASIGDFEMLTYLVGSVIREVLGPDDPSWKKVRDRLRGERFAKDIELDE